jgi:hypothetical protein
MYMKYMIFQVTEEQSSGKKDAVSYWNKFKDILASPLAAVTVCEWQENISAWYNLFLITVIRNEKK